MSGPKYSRAVLRDARTLQRLMEQLQREIEVQKCRELTAEIMQQITKSKAFLRSAKDYRALIDLVNTKGATSESKQLQKLQEKLQKLQPSPFTQGNSSQLAHSLSELTKQFRQMQRLEQQIDALAESLHVLVTQRQQIEREKAFIETSWDQVQEYAELKDQRVQAALESAYDVLAALDDGDAWLDRFAAIEHEHTGSTQDQLERIEQFVKSARIEASFQQHHEIVLEESVEYHSLCKMTGQKADEGLERASMVKASAQMKASIAESHKQAYVAATVQEVLGSMGYTLLTEPQSLVATAPTQKAYYGLSKDSILNVSASSTGALMFEVQGVKHGDAVTESQKARVVQDMERFCPDYTKVKAALHARGIELEDERLFPPLEQYVRFSDIKFAECQEQSAAPQQKEHYLSDE